MNRHQNQRLIGGGVMAGQNVVQPPPLDPLEMAKATELFEHFLTATTLKTILGSYRLLCDIVHLKPNLFPLFYPKLKASLTSWKAKALWKKFDLRAAHKCYGRGKICANTRVLIIGGGPCGLRTAIEAQLLGAKVVVVEKRDRITRNNVLHLWPFVIDDLRGLGAKKFFGKFCAGAIDHISIRQLQVILLKVALLLGVELHTEVSFKDLLEPSSKDKIGWRAEFVPADHPVSQYEFDVCIGADGKRNTVHGFSRKEFRGKLAIAITANFINKRTEAEARVEEISGVAFIFNQKFFKELYAETGIDLENIVYYKDDTHYFVMTAKKHSLIDKGVIVQDLPDTAKLLAPENVDREALMSYARQAANFSTLNQMPALEFAVNHYGQPDVAMFDFTSMYAAENASRVFEKCGHKLLMMLVGDSLLEPFWPTGSGCARGFLSSLDACWAIRNWGSGAMTPLEVISERESIYRLLGQTTPENLHRDCKSYTLDPSTRYPNLNRNIVVPLQVVNLYDTDDPANIEKTPRALPVNVNVQEMPKKRRRQSAADPNTLLPWLRDQVREYEDLSVNDLTTSFKDGRVLCAILHHYRPDLLDYSTVKPEDVAKNNQLAFDLLEREIGILPVMTGQGMAQCTVPDYLTMLAYLSSIYEHFRGEIPHIKHPKLPSQAEIPQILLPEPLPELVITVNEKLKKHKRSIIITAFDTDCEQQSCRTCITISYNQDRVENKSATTGSFVSRSSSSRNDANLICQRIDYQNYCRVNKNVKMGEVRPVSDIISGGNSFVTNWVKSTRKINAEMLDSQQNANEFCRTGAGLVCEPHLLVPKNAKFSRALSDVSSMIVRDPEKFACFADRSVEYRRNLDREQNGAGAVDRKSYLPVPCRTGSTTSSGLKNKPLKSDTPECDVSSSQTSDSAGTICCDDGCGGGASSVKKDAVECAEQSLRRFASATTFFEDSKSCSEDDATVCCAKKNLEEAKISRAKNKNNSPWGSAILDAAISPIPEYFENFSQSSDSRNDLPELKKSEYKMPKMTPSNFSVHSNASVIPPVGYVPTGRPSGRHKRHADGLNLMDSRLQTPDRKARKRRTVDKHQLALSMEEKQQRWDDIVANRCDRQNRRRYQRKTQTEQFIKSMQMLQANCRSDESGPFEDYSIYLYRQTAPNFEDRVKNLEKQFIYFPEKDSKLPTLSKGANDEDFTERIKDFEVKLRETAPSEKRPKDLMRAIGKIETSDWNIKEIEKKINENKMGKNTNKEKEKVPKWSREQFLARQTKMEKQHLERQDSTGGKFVELDKGIKELDMKLKEGTAREQGLRGANKVATITEKLTSKTETEQPKPIQKSNSKTAVPALPTQGGSEFCHFCSKRVYLMERLSAEGRFFHRGCFKCQYCGIALRLGSYLFDREGQYGHRFYCTQHFGMQGSLTKATSVKGNKIVRKSAARLNREQGSSPDKKVLNAVAGVDLLDRVQTPERVEFANLSTGFVSSDHEESQMDEDEWTDRNFGASTAEVGSSDDDSSESSDDDSDDEEVFEEALEEPPTKEGTLRWAERMKKKYDQQIDYDSDSDQSSYYENTSSDDESETATEGEEEIRARELRKQEVDVKEPVVGSDTETEVASDESSTESSSVEQNSATEISTDSEFAQDDPTPTREIPSIVLNDCNVTKTRGSLHGPKKVQVQSGVLQRKTAFLTSVLQSQNETQKTPIGDGDIELKFTPLVPSSPLISAHRTPPPDIANVKPSLNLLNARNEGYSLNRTQSTGGIATKVSLELKKKYLLGGDQFGSSIQKSGSASTLDSKLKSFTSNISEHQKLLQHTNEVSPSMQAFFQSTSANKISPLVPTKDILNENKLNEDKSAKIESMAELPEKTSPKVIDDFDIRPDLTRNIIIETVSIEEKGDLPKVTEEILKAGTPQSQVVEFENENEGRPRSPVHETTIPVPTINWNKEPAKNKKSDTDFSDSLSSSDTSSEEESDEMKTGLKSPNVKTFSEIPRVEIHDSCGEVFLEEEDEDMALDSLCVVSDVVKVVPTTAIEEQSDSIPHKSITSEKKSLNQPKALPQLEKTTTPEPEPFATVAAPEISRPDISLSGRSSPVSVSESMGIEATTAALTETELSDWARDGTVSDDFEDEDFGMNPDYSTVRRNKKPKDVPAAPTGDGKKCEAAEARIASIEDFDDMSHVCGKDKQIKEATNKTCIAENAARLAEFDSIEYMDTGTEESSDENAVVNNTGYVQFVDDDEIAQDSLIPHITEINEAINPAVAENAGYCIFENEVEPEDFSFGGRVIDLKATDLEELRHKQSLCEHEEDSLLILDAGTTTEETTTTSDTTVKNILESESFKEEITEAKEVPAAVVPPKEQEDTKIASAAICSVNEDVKYQEHCQRLQSRNVEFGNVRDSIDIRKSRRKSKSESPPLRKPDLIQEEKPEAPIEPVVTKPPPAVNRREEIEKQRNEEKRLVHEMVLNKILAEKKLTDSAKKKRNRNSFSPGGPLDLMKSATADISFQQTPTDISPASKLYSTISSSNSSSVYVTPDVLLTTTPTTAKLDNFPLQKSQTVAGIPDNFNRPSRLYLSERRNDEFYTPVFVDKQQPLSVHSSFLVKQKVPNASTVSPPLVKPENNFSLPDIRKALFSDEFKTPVPPPRMKYSEDLNRTAEKLKQDARARARLKSDEDLGLSPEDLRLLKLRQKMLKSKGKENEDLADAAQRNVLLYNDTLGRHKKTLFSQSPTRLTIADNENFMITKKPELAKSLDTDFESALISPVSEINLCRPIEVTPNKLQFFKSDPNLLLDTQEVCKRDKKKSKDRERRKSITKFLSEFFTKRKDSSPKTPNSNGTGSSSKGFLSRISPKAKEKSKSCLHLDGDGTEKVIVEETCRRKSFSGPTIRQEQSPPPIPPPPLNYPDSRHSRGTECYHEIDSGSDVECDWRRLDRSSCDTLDQSGTVDGSVNSLGGRKPKGAKRVARQAQLKRHRMAQEIQRKLEETEVKTRELEQRGVEVEKALRGEMNGASSAVQECARDESELLREWFDLMRDRTELRRYERELMVRAQELQLEDRHARLQHDLRERLTGSDETKTREDIATESAILNEMLEIVAKRDSLIVLLEEDRQRYNEEDKDLEEQMLAKGLRLTPLKKSPD